MERKRVLWISAILIGVLLCVNHSDRGKKTENRSASGPAAESRSELAEGEQIFAYHVLADAVRRSVDALRYIDAVLVALLAAQAAILAIFVERPIAASGPMYWALFIAVPGLAVTALARDGPKANDFAIRFPKNPVDTRASLMNRFEHVVAWNGGLHVVKSVLLIGCLGMTLWGVLASTGFDAVLSGAGR